MLRKQIIVTSHSGAGYKRDETTIYGKYNADSPEEMEKYAKAVKKLQKAFADRKIKWWMAYEGTINFTDATMSVVMRESHAHEEIPPLEINTAAKGYVPAPKVVGLAEAQHVWAAGAAAAGQVEAQF